MVFNSFSFLIFFVVFYAFYIILSEYQTAKKWLILSASFLFYGWWDWRFLFLILLSILVNHFFATQVRRYTDAKSREKIIFVCVTFNLAILGVFKYYGFFIDSFISFINLFVNTESVTPLNIILPVGISFFTFQAMCYVIDTHRGKIADPPTLLEFSVYLSLFPQLVAGPIVRASSLIPQIQSPPRITWADLYAGYNMILWGFFLKLALAENAAPIANTVFAEVQLLSSYDVAIGVFAFAMQIYGDFAGYSLIAIGLGRLMGFDFGVNFRRPYFASSFSDFWNRWHISLSSWLRDYLYIPLGGNRAGKLKTYRNLMLTMLIGGLWHGASWNFIIWGGLHGMYLSFEKLTDVPGKIEKMSPIILKKSVAEMYTIAIFVCVCIAWIFFRVDSFTDSVQMISKVVYFDFSSTLGLDLIQLLSFVIVVFIVVMKDLFDECSKVNESTSPASLAAKLYSGAVFALVFFMLLVFGKFTTAAFIYFQF